MFPDWRSNDGDDLSCVQFSTSHEVGFEYRNIVTAAAVSWASNLVPKAARRTRNLQVFDLAVTNVIDCNTSKGVIGKSVWT